ncbi:MAG: hypothetical protein WD048_06575 [Chitinophagales bacterium]
MRYASLFLILVLIIIVSSCNKKDNIIAEPSFEEIITSKMWVKNSNVRKLETTDPDDTTATIEYLLKPCDSMIIMSFQKDGVYQKYYSSECIEYSGSSAVDRWEYNKEDKNLKLYASSLTHSSSSIIKQFSENEIVLYGFGLELHGNGYHVYIEKLVPVN